MTAPSTRAATRLYVFESGGENSLKGLFDPWAAECGEIGYIPYYFFAIEHPEGWVLVDVGAHPELARDAQARLGAQAEFSDIVMAEGDDVVGKIAAVGIAPEDVRHVILTHLHFDHCGGLDLLPEATVHAQKKEFEFATNPPVYQRDSYISADWARVEHWALHDGEHDLFVDGSIRMIPTPGHTPGHQSVLVRLADRTVILMGDAAYHPEKMAQRRLPSYLWNPDALISSWELLESLRDEYDAELVFSHYPIPGETQIAPIPYGH
jgi:glyoxylase-like metal-dependent hydrolase (beta-lactamase superfamily II)